MKSAQVFTNIITRLKANYFYNPELKIIASKESYPKLVEHYFDLSGLDNKRFRELESSTKCIINFPEIRAKFLEKILGYERLN